MGPAPVREDEMTDCPAFDEWLAEIKNDAASPRVGMYLMHDGVVRGTSRAGKRVTGMDLSYDRERLRDIVSRVQARPGIVAVRAWVNQGRLAVGDDIMRALVAGDIRENVSAAFQELIRLIKTECVQEWEMIT
jgi:molybdopterin synthase catalytic subunit